MSKRYVVYQLINTVTNKKYIGVTTQGIKKRLDHHIKKPTNSLLEKDFKDFGTDKFIIESLYEAKDIEDMLNKELQFIQELNTLSPNGYNMSLSCRFTSRTEEEKQKFRKQHIIEDGIEKKHCSECESYLPLNNFGKWTRKWDGLYFRCKPCENKYNNKRRGSGKKVSKSNRIGKSGMKPLIRIDKDGIQVGYKSALYARDDGFNNTNISVAIKMSSLYHGYYWKFDV